jgi:hypothetical protein
MTIGVIIPTRGNRPVFLHQAKCLLASQTLKPQHVDIVDHPAEGDVIDVAQRYKIGFEKLFAKGCDLVICWEDDDWYAPIYIEIMVNKWILYGKPDLFGIGSTIYYHLISQRYLELCHPNRASMFSTAVTKKVLDLDISKSNEYLDDFLWVKMRGKITARTYLIPKSNKPICIGMKHGSTLVAGGAHEPDSKYYTKHDFNYDLLRPILGPDFNFYSKTLFALGYTKNSLRVRKLTSECVYGSVNPPTKISENATEANVKNSFRLPKPGLRVRNDQKHGYNSSVNLVSGSVNTHSKEEKTKLDIYSENSDNGGVMKVNQFLTIITRCFKRPNGLSKNQSSIAELSDQDFEQIFITDSEGVGLAEANKSFGFVNDLIEGKYVFLLDDDDFITNPEMISELKKISDEYDPDVIFFRMTIKNNQNGNYYPTTELCWGNKPIIARIGGSCFVVKSEVYKKFIHHFAKPRCGDFYFIEAVFNSGAKVYWHDVKMCETGKVSRGKPEV